MKIQALGRGVRGQQNANAAAGERLERAQPLDAGQAAVKDCDRLVDMARQVRERVAVFSKDDERLSDPAKKAPNHAELRLRPGADRRRVGQRRQQPALALAITKSQHFPPRRRPVRIRQLAVLVERQQQLCRGGCEVREGIKPASDGLPQRMRA